MRAPNLQRADASHSVCNHIRCTLLLLSTLFLLTAPLVAQTEQEAKRKADRLNIEALQLAQEGTKESLEQALSKLLIASPLYHAAGDTVDEATTLLAIGYIYNSLGEPQQAVNYYKQALPLSRSIGDRAVEAGTLNQIGLASSALGEQQQALDYYLQALPLVRALGDRRTEAGVLNNIGMVYADLGASQQALDYYSQALSLDRSAGDLRSEAETLDNICVSYYELGEEQQALDHCKQALSLHSSMGNRRGEAKALGNIGIVYYALGEQQQALNSYKQALPLYRAIGDKMGEARSLSNIGPIYAALGDQQQALDSYLQALPLLRAIGDRNGEAAALFNIAYSERAIGKLADALTHIEASIAILESLRTKIGGQELRSAFFATVQDYYELYIDLLMRLHKQQPDAGYDSKALQASERERARSLLELLTEAHADIRQGVEPQLVERERALQQQLNKSAQRQIQLLSGQHTETQADAIAKEIEHLTIEFQQVETEIRQTSPRYAALTQPVPLTLKEIQTQVLDADTVLLEYALGTDRSYLWAVTPTSSTSYELPKRAEIETGARAFYKFLHTSPQQAASNEAAKQGLGAEMQQQTQAQGAQTAAQLSRMLLAPASALLGKKRLLIVADGALQYIPFAALPVPADAASGAAPMPLIIEHEIVSLSSASTLAVLRREAGEHKAATKTLVVLADPVFERTDERFKARAGQSARGATTPVPPVDESRGLSLFAAKSAQESGVATADLQIPRLLATRREADAISALAPTAARRELLDFAASRAAATDPSLADYRFVHFATHGFLDSQHPELSGILLSLFNEQGRAQDGFLRAHEVFNLKLNADAVVLSACQTGLGKDVKGEGLVGLTRGFMYAGAPRVVVSLWSVNDAATAELMTRFYHGMLVEKLRPARALQAAQVSMLKDKRFSAPFYWAAFTLQGEFH